MRFKAAIFILFLSLAFSSCKLYQVTHYKGADFSKVKDVNDYTVYVHYKSKSYQVDKPVISPAGVKGTFVPLTDEAKVNEIKNPATPHQLRKHKHDLNVYAKTDLKDTAATTVMLKKNDIKEITVTTVQSKINWKAIGNGILTVLVIAFCIGLIGLIIYWFTLI